MGKVSSNGTGSGGDERNIYIRRYKSTSNSSKASSNTSLAKTMGESETLSRSKQTSNIVKQHTNKEKNNLKNKLRSPVKIGSGPTTNLSNKTQIISTHNEIKKSSGSIQKQNLMTKMKQESENLECKQKFVNLQPENRELNEQVENIKQITELNLNNDQLIDQLDNGNTNELHKKESVFEDNFNDNEINKNGQREQNKEVPEINENEEFNLHLEVEENIMNRKEGIQNSYQVIEDRNKQDSTKKELKILIDEIQEHLQTSPESCSEDVVESTTPEVSNITDSIILSEIKNNEIKNENENNDAVSYDSCIMLKDVKIKLNDCLKDAKPEDDHADQGLLEYAHKEFTFGKTLRTISGRHSIGRMRHITLRDRQPSPNSSLFVNTSHTSFSEENIPDYKSFRHYNTVSELTSSNGSTPIERKRKISESISDLKKPKTEDSSLWNTSFELIKYPFSMRRPIYVSTSRKFHAEKLNLSDSNESKMDDSGIIKKWCVIM